MTKPMTLEEAVRVFRDYIEIVSSSRDSDLHRAEDVLLAHAEATLAAREGEPEGVEIVRWIAGSNTTSDMAASIDFGSLRETAKHIDTLTAERDAAREERDFLVEEYERALRIEPRGFAHAAGHIYNAISNAQFEANWKQSETIRADRDRLAACVERVRRVCERADTYVDGDVILAALEAR
jgi:hypothetical protein